MSGDKSSAVTLRIEQVILTVRSQRVILDCDLAAIYGVTTKALNQAVRRNTGRFPADFVFRLTLQEVTDLKSQIVTSNTGLARGETGMWSQNVTTSKPQRRRLSNLPWAFTEHGAVMAANFLRSPRAVEMSVYVVRAFIMQREALATNATILKRLAEIDRTLLEHDSALQILWKRLQSLLTPPPVKPRRKIGFHAGNR
ncbi:MAG: ORF6N domain-containing protein [Terriglobales bacterium]